MEDKKHDISVKILSLISHKLRTPLSIITGYSEALSAQKGKEKMSPFTEKAVDEIYKQGNQMAFLVDRLIRFTKIDDLQPSSIVKTSVNLRDIITSAAQDPVVFPEDPGKKPETNGDIITKGRVRVEISCPQDFIVMTDATLLKEALKEIINNAIKFNNNPDKIIKIYCFKHTSNVSVSVKDNGTGIRPGEITRIFERFYQIDEFFTGQVEGWGLGLSFAKNIINLLGGSLSVVSDIGLGSVFTFTIPN